ncbi:MAG TPA: DUF2461 domain-containing protein [Bacteroidales bacterium]|nr:DUF2461 domain-containing protein [Bacteroidales bacterium]
MNAVILSFLKELEKNNNREWFHAHKDLYDEARKEFELFVDSLIPGIAKFDASVKFIAAKDCIFRIFRDIRFSNDKTPYKTNFGAFISKGGRKSHGPGYYFHMQPGEFFLSGGVWMPEAEVMKKIRQEIYYNIAEFKKILNNKSFKEYFSGIDDWDRQKLAPREYPKDFPDIGLLKNRSFTISHSMTEKTLARKDLAQYALKVYKAMYPYNQFLTRAVEG